MRRKIAVLTISTLIVIAISVILATAKADAFSYDRIYFFGLQQRHIWEQGKAFYIERVVSGCQRALDKDIYLTGCINLSFHPLIVEFLSVEEELRKAQTKFGQSMVKLVLVPGLATQ